MDLQQFVEKISTDVFLLPFRHQAVWNPRLITTGGRYHPKTHHLDFNPKVLEIHGEEVFEGIVKHELCHYHLHLSRRGFHHKDQDFKELLNAVGGLRFTPTLSEKKRLTYQCKNCLQRFERQRKINTKRFVCGKCRGRLELVLRD